MATSARRCFIGRYQESDPACVLEGMAVAISKTPLSYLALYQGNFMGGPSLISRCCICIAMHLQYLLGVTNGALGAGGSRRLYPPSRPSRCGHATPFRANFCRTHPQQADRSSITSRARATTDTHAVTSTFAKGRASIPVPCSGDSRHQKNEPGRALPAGSDVRYMPWSQLQTAGARPSSSAPPKTR